MMRITALALLAAGCTSAATVDAREVALGKALFHDPSLSSPKGQACADCHADTFAFRDPESDVATSTGVVPGRVGPRNAPSIMYSAFTPELHVTPTGYMGGQFWDGRADDLERQAAAPLLNPLEMNNPDEQTVVNAVLRGPSAKEMTALYGEVTFDHIVEAISAYERTLSPFNSRYDAFVAGRGTLTAQELRGKALFEGKANCASCHPAPMFTTYGYANLGVPRYGNLPYYEAHPEYVDHGLMTTTHDAAQDGMFRIPSLRNIAKTGPYGHNGYFNSLPYFLDFLNTRDVGSTSVGNCSRTSPFARCAWPAPEIAANVDHTTGNLHLSDDELAALGAFLNTLTDNTTNEAIHK